MTPTEDPAASQAPPLPTTRGRLVGRKDDLAEVSQLLLDSGTRLLSLVGVGGAGKTRLALAVAAEVAPHFTDGVAFAAFDGLGDAALVPTRIAEALGIRDDDRRTDLDRVVTWLRGRSLLLVLDNVEHLPEVGKVAAVLLERCPGLRVLATSRVPLHLRVERRFAVRPLAVPDATADAAAARHAPAIQLLVERIAEGRPDFFFDDDDAPALVDLVRRLDGLPLALELAAGRLRNRTTGIDRLGDLVAVGSAARAIPTRQRTVRTVLDWSYDLLPAETQRALRAISVHVGPFDAATAEDLAEGPFDLASLVEHSLVQPVGDRYALLALIREYAGEKRITEGDDARVRARWIARALSLAEDAASQLAGPTQRAWLTRLELELENLRAVLDHLLTHDAPSAAVQLAGALTRFWYLHGHYHEGRRWLRRALVGAPDAPTRARALQGAGRLSFLQCDYPEARRLLEQAVSASADAPDIRLAATQALGSVAREQADYPAALAYHEACLSLAPSPVEIARSRAYIGFAAWMSGDLARGRRELTAAAGAFAVLDDAEGIATTQLYLGGLALAAGDVEGARTACARGLSLSRAAGFLEGVAWAQNLLGNCDLERGDVDRATEALRASLAIHLALGDLWRAASVLEALARTNAARGRYGRAARILGAAGQLRDTIGTPVPPVERPPITALEATLREQLGPDADAEVASGRHLELEDAAALARTDKDDLPPPVWW